MIELWRAGSHIEHHKAVRRGLDEDFEVGPGALPGAVGGCVGDRGAPVCEAKSIGISTSAPASGERIVTAPGTPGILVRASSRREIL